MKLSDIRKDYTLKSLDISDVSTDPFRQFSLWFDEAVDSEALEVNAMCLSTLGLDGYPSGRIVLLKGVDEGFVFFTNYSSAKGKEIEAMPKASLTFFWAELERQVRIVGDLEKISEAESDEYFFSRPVGSQIGAWTSPQSQRIENREVLAERNKQLEDRFSREPITRPPHWGGYRLKPKQFEFWQGRSSRLHDRIGYEKNGEGKWTIFRLAP
ncbi:pyridoxamine 5'-phosphate oxidase [Algoriphagus taiwanensis]|uniref:Pyridoxine/pyridoxamine 5'-phosphate oxidase n=1 Tax=Algoriphagus taiwanensis TaxID=1445656 RepID=A0ABQ6PYD2_9BACT|nr:pyridoxamine 5'-phosphate oxidase [Algoriphagus taiwanensis]